MASLDSVKGLQEQQTTSVVQKDKRKLDIVGGPSSKRRKVIDPSQSIGYKTDQEVPFTRILYNRQFFERLSPNHILNKCHKGDGGVRMLVESILSVNTGITLQDVTVDTLMQVPEFTSIINKILKNHRRLSLRHLVSLYCKHNKRGEISPDKCKITAEVVATMMRCAHPERGDMSLQEDLLQHELQPLKSQPFEDVHPLGWEQVFEMLLAVLRRVIPREVWGSTHNLCVMKTAIKNILTVGRHDKLYLGNLLMNIKTNCCRWAASVDSFVKKTYIIAKVYLWIMVHLVMSTLHSVLYVTETSCHRNQLVFYRKRVWQRRHDRALSTLLRSNALREVNETEKMELSSLLSASTTQTSRGTSYPRIRFLPKAKGVRPIIPSRREGISQALLRKARILINQLCILNKKASVTARSAADLHSAWRTNVKKLASSETKDPVYFVRADVQDAYGSIDHSKLFELLDKCSEHLSPKLRFGEYSTFKKIGEVSKCTYILLNDNGQPTSQSQGEALLETGSPLIFDKDEVISAIKAHVKAQVVSNGARQVLHVTRGLPQGGTLSGLLCELYYSSLCATHLSGYNTGTSILLRKVDDFLFLSTSHGEAEKFLKQVNKGMPEYNCRWNPRKTVHNLHTKCEHRVYFAGVVVCLKSLQLLVDASRLACGHPRYSLSLNRFKAPGDLVAKRLQQVSTSRLPPHVLDPLYTRRGGLVCNVWRAGFMAGARLLAMLTHYLAPRGPLNAKFIASAVFKVGHGIRRRVKAIWDRANVELSFPDEVILIAYVGGVSVMLKWPGLPSWPAVHTRLEDRLKSLKASLPNEFHGLLPTVRATTLL